MLEGRRSVAVGLAVIAAAHASACSNSDARERPDSGIADAGRGVSPSVASGGTGGGGAGLGGAAGNGAAGTRGTSSGGTAGATGAGDGGIAGASGSTGATDGDAGAFPGDTFLPWAGGPSYFTRWTHGPPADPSFFPVAVWLQSPSNANRYKAVGVNVFVGLWQGPTEQQLVDLKSAGIPTFCDQGGVWNTHLTDGTLWGWLQPDEPDNAQANSSGGYDPCIPPSTIVAGYDTMVANDGTRPVWLGFGRGVSDTTWVGRGTCTGHTEMYAEYAKGGDILSFDIYPVNDGIGLEAVPKGVDNLRQWSGYSKPVVADIEASDINDTTRPSPAQIRSEIWMALVHGAAGIQYFCHRFAPTFSETDCLDDAPTADAMKAIDAQIASLAPVLNTPSVGNGVTVASSDPTKPIDVMLKRHDGATYVFATEMRDGTTTGTFTLRDFPAAASAEVLGEGRSIAVTNGVLEDDFSSYGVHLYRIAP